MSIDALEAEALKLDPSARARLAERLLESLETLSEEEDARLWAEEAERRGRAWDPTASQGATRVGCVRRRARPLGVNAGTCRKDLRFWNGGPCQRL